MYSILVDNFLETTTTTVEHAQSLAQDYLEEFGYGADVKVVFEEEYAQICQQNDTGCLCKLDTVSNLHLSVWRDRCK